MACARPRGPPYQAVMEQTLETLLTWKGAVVLLWLAVFFIAERVRRSRGPSGSNVEYVLRLAEALRAMRASDEHVFALAELLEETR